MAKANDCNQGGLSVAVADWPTYPTWGPPTWNRTSVESCWINWICKTRWKLYTFLGSTCIWICLSPQKIKNLKHIPDGFPKWCGWTNGKIINSSTQHIQAHVQMIYLLNPIESYWILSFPMAIFQFVHIFPLRLGLQPKLASVWRICWHPSAEEPWSFDGQWLCLKMVNWRIRMAIKEDQNGNK